MHAVHKKQMATAIALIRVGADVNATAGDLTPLMMAAGYGDAPMIRMLIENGANPHKTAADGSNALTAAVGGVPDIDNFTVGRCQSDAVAALRAFSPELGVECRLTRRNHRKRLLMRHPGHVAPGDPPRRRQRRVPQGVKVGEVERRPGAAKVPPTRGADR